MRSNFIRPATTQLRGDDDLDLDALLHPAQAFAHPSEVISDPDLTLAEKRAILAPWASDACAVEAVPALRQAPGTSPVRFDEIMDALRTLDEQYKPEPHYRRVHRGAFPACSGATAAAKATSKSRPSIEGFKKDTENPPAVGAAGGSREVCAADGWAAA